MRRTWPAPVALKTPEPGDFCCLPISGGIGLGITIGQWLDGDRLQPYDHAEIYVGQADEHGPYGYTIGAYPSGAARLPLLCPPEQLPGSLWSSGIIELPRAQRDEIVLWATEHLGTPYSFLDYAAIALHGVHIDPPGLQDYIRSTHHLICSQLVDLAYSRSGVHLFDDGRWEGYVKPGDLAMLLQSRGHLTLTA
jgi:hypothetical protein